MNLTLLFQVQKLESDIMPLQQANSELSEKSGMLQAEKKILEEEIKRWKARTQVSEKKQLIMLLVAMTILFLMFYHFTPLKHNFFLGSFSIW